MGETKLGYRLLRFRNKLVSIVLAVSLLPFRLFFLSLLLLSSAPTSFAQTPTTQIDVLVLVDDAIFSSESGKNAFVQGQFGQLNDTILSNTELNDVIFNVAAVEEIPHQNLNVAQALAKLKSSSAPWNNVQTLRNEATPEPDIIVAFIQEEPSSSGACGIADEPVPDAKITADQNIAVIGYTCTIAGSVQYTLAHELGHLLGATHGSGFSKEGSYNTIMAVGCKGSSCHRIPYFSTPLQSYSGETIGSVTQNNTSRIRGGAREVALYAGSGEPSGLTCPEARYVPTRPRDPAAPTVYQGSREFQIDSGENPEHWGFFVAPKTAAYNTNFIYSGGGTVSSYKTELFRDCDDAAEARSRGAETGKRQSIRAVQLLEGERIYFKTTQLYGRPSYSLSASFKAAEFGTNASCEAATPLKDKDLTSADDSLPGIVSGDIRSTTSPVWHYFTAPEDADYVIRVEQTNANQYMLLSALYWGGCDLEEDDETAKQEREFGRDALRRGSDQWAHTLGRVPLKRDEKLYIRLKLPKHYDEENADQAYQVKVDRVVSELDEAVLASRFLMVWNVETGSNADRAGIRRGDAIVRYNGQVIRSLQDLLIARDNAVKLKLETVRIDVLNKSSGRPYGSKTTLGVYSFPIDVGPLGITTESDSGSSLGSDGSGTYPPLMMPVRQ